MATATEVLQRVIRGGSFLIEERSPEEIMTPEDFTEEQRQIARTASTLFATRCFPLPKRLRPSISTSPATC